MAPKTTTTTMPAQTFFALRGTRWTSIAVVAAASKLLHFEIKRYNISSCLRPYLLG